MADPAAPVPSQAVMHLAVDPAQIQAAARAALQLSDDIALMCGKTAADHWIKLAETIVSSPDAAALIAAIVTHT